MLYRPLTITEENMAQDFMKNHFFMLPLIKFSLDYCFTLGAFDENAIVGIFQTSCVIDEADIIGIGISPNYRRQGIAKNLFKTFLSLRPEIRNVSLEVSKENFPAFELYLNLGFKTIGVRKNYYQNQEKNTFEDAYLMKFSCKNT